MILLLAALLTTAPTVDVQASCKKDAHGVYTECGTAPLGQMDKFDDRLSWLTFGSGISVNSVTGEVRVPKGLPLSVASKQFWNMVADTSGRPRPFPDVQP